MGIERWTDSIQWGPSRVRDVSIMILCSGRRFADSDVILSRNSYFTQRKGRHKEKGIRQHRIPQKRRRSMFIIQ
jgi:hypothetical protein